MQLKLVIGVARYVKEDWWIVSRRPSKIPLPRSREKFLRRRKRRWNSRRHKRDFLNLKISKRWVPVGHFTEHSEVLALTILAFDEDPQGEGPRDGVVCEGSPAKLELTVGGESLLPPEGPLTELVYVEACPALTPSFILEKQSKPSPFQYHSKEVVAFDNKTSPSLWVFWFLLLVANQRRSTVVALQILLLVVRNMYPLFHRCAARKGRSSQRPKFDPLVVDPLALVILDDDMGGLNVMNGELPHVQVEHAAHSSDCGELLVEDSD
ncbi:hypothetical protein AMTR_s00007p00238120 [Amborella trichopoda]|uniref:Uncharacterized protein n=1 Tax=Amborella trichopoda TaxID=13333 RepID=W1PCS8_AMBTC|nr:hypothetical protein AMTR_s00007p00238120 [Amborella trichopoda]